MHISKTWQILFPPGGAAESGKIFGRAYIPETPGVNPNEEKEVEFCSEVLILASTFQAAVGGKKTPKQKTTELHIAGHIEKVSYFITNRVRKTVDIPAMLTFHTTEGIILLVRSDNQC